MESVVDVPGFLAQQSLLDDVDQVLGSLRLAQLQNQLLRHVVYIAELPQLRNLCTIAQVPADTIMASKFTTVDAFFLRMLKALEANSWKRLKSGESSPPITCKYSEVNTTGVLSISHHLYLSLC